MKVLNYILNGFGYDNANDFKRSCCGIILQSSKADITVIVVSALGAVRIFLNDFIGFDLPVFASFVFLIAAEFWTGVKVSRIVYSEKFKSRKFGRMLLKIGTYVTIISILNQFSKNVDAPDVMGVSLNPFTWLYYTVFIAIVFQLLVSWLENLGALGYKETKTIAGFILRKFNTWFEFDGSKNNEER